MMKRNFLISITILIFFCGCHNSGHANTASSFKDSTIGKRQNDSLKEKLHSTDENFDNFFLKFRSDSIFQKLRITFPLKLTIIGDEGESDSTKFIGEKDWKSIKVFSVYKKKEILKKRNIDSNHVKVKYSVQDTGIELHFEFVKKNHKWALVFVENLSD